MQKRHVRQGEYETDPIPRVQRPLTPDLDGERLRILTFATWHPRPTDDNMDTKTLRHNPPVQQTVR